MQPAIVPSDARIRHFVISGTSYWNPGDDFVRDGVIHILQSLFPGDLLNFHFYNFNEDYLPKSKFKGIGNEVSAGDLKMCRDFIDGVVIAGLSAGREIKDLYRWVIESGLDDRVYLIGAGYENPYCASNIIQEPEATIFRKARIITGRTANHPAYIDQVGTRYVHLNCPALLSVNRVKDVPVGKRIERIGFSIQLPHEAGIPNQSCDTKVSRLAVDVLFALAKTHRVEVIAHHKSEYFCFLQMLKGTDIPVLYSSFYRDLHEIYPRYDLVVTTRLHSSLFANGHGIPGIIINDTDRHTHTLRGFPHSTWVNTREAFDREFNRLNSANLSTIAQEATDFKATLTQRYIETLREPFGVAPLAEQAASSTAPLNLPESKSALAERLRAAVGSPEIKQRVVAVFEQLTADHWLKSNIEDYRRAIKAKETWFDTPSFLNWFAEAIRPVTYLEIGVRRGRSMAQVLTRSPATKAYGFDLWIPDYGSIPEEGIVTTNPGPEFILAELKRLGVSTTPVFTRGNSHVTVPAFFADSSNPQKFDLMLVDGDHTDEGARQDLELAFDHLAPGGVIVFDDTRNRSHPGLQAVWDAFKSRYPDFLFIEDDHRTGTAIAVKPPFTSLQSLPALKKPISTDYQFDSEKKEQALVRSVVKSGMTVFDVGAHVGKYTKLFSLLVGEAGRVFSFEPTPRSADKLSRMIEAERLDNVTLNRMAVCDRRGDIVLHQFPEEYSSWNGIGRPTMADPRDPAKTVPIVGAVKVPCINLDSFCEEHGIERIDYLKLDVEGAEILALLGAQNLFRRKAVGCLQFEISRKMLEGLGTRARQVFDFLAANNYVCHTIRNDGSIGEVAVDSNAFYENYLAVPAVQSVQVGADRDLPIHFFTIVLNGQPFIRHHIEVFRHLPFPWHWHIVEGVADLNHDTGWSKARGGRVATDFHRAGLSMDGTSEYLDALKREFPQNITLHRPSTERFWDGKREMVNAPVAAITQECLLWQIDADELWTLSQVVRTRQLFLSHPDKTAALFRCHFFVGRDLVITSRDTYGNQSKLEWLRVWRFQPGDRWITHEPPRLGRTSANGTVKDIGEINPFRHAETEALSLIFQHYAYATEAQVRFKESYYGYEGAVDMWRALQGENRFPQRLAEFLLWVKDGAIVDTTSAAGVARLAPDEWFDAPSELLANNPLVGAKRILFVRTDSIGDAVLASGLLEVLHRRFPGAKIAVLCQAHIAELYAACPCVEKVITVDRSKARDEHALRAVVDQIERFNPDVVLNSVRSRDFLSELLTLAHRKAYHIAISSDASNLVERERAEAERLYEKIIPAEGANQPEIERHRQFLAGLGIEVSSLQPTVWTTLADEKAAEQFFADRGLVCSKTIAVFPGAQYDERVYSRYVEALEHLSGYDFVVFGTVAERSLGESMAGRLKGKVVNLCGATSLRQTAALLRRCRLYVGAESAGAHMACAVGVPNVVLLGGGHFGRFMPYSPLTSAVSLPLECFGCNWKCRHTTAHCVKDIAPIVVAEAIRSTLAQPSAKPRLFVQASTHWAPQAGQPQWKRPDTLLSNLDVEVIVVGPANETAASTSAADTLIAGARSAIERGDARSAIKALTEARRHRPDDPDILIVLGNLHFQGGEFAAAYEALSAATASPKDDPLLYVMLAHAAVRLDRVQDFEKALAQAFHLDPNFAPAHRLIADLQAESGNLREAVNIYGKLMEQNPSDIEILLPLGRCLMQLGQREGAHACFQRVLQFDPCNEAAQAGLAALSIRTSAKPPSSAIVGAARGVLVKGS